MTKLSKLQKAMLGIAVVLAAIWAALPSGPVLATQDPHVNINPTPRDCPTCGLTSDPFGVASNQAARLNILNADNERGLVVNWKFLDSEGNTLAETGERVMVSPGQIISVEFFADGHSVATDRFGRIQTRVVVTTERRTPEPHLSVEVFDTATGKTTFTTKFCQNNL